MFAKNKKVPIAEFKPLIRTKKLNLKWGNIYA